MTYFALQPGAQSKSDPSPPRGTRLVSLEQLRMPNVGGLTIRFRRTWAPSFVAQSVARCKQAGKPYTLLMMGGDVANPAHPSHFAALERSIDDLGERYADDPLCWGVHACLPPQGTSEEPYWSKPVRTDVERTLAQVIAVWRDSFRRQKILFAVTGRDVACMRRLIALGLDICGADFTVKNNALKTSTSIAADHNQLVIEAGKAGCGIGFEMAGSQTHEKQRVGTLAGSIKQAVEMGKRAGKPVSYCAIYPPDLGFLKGVAK